MKRHRRGLRHRLYLQIYLALCGALALFAVASSILWWMAPRDREADVFLGGMAVLVGEALPPEGAAAAEQQAALERLSKSFAADLTLLDDEGRTIAVVGQPLVAPRFPLRGGAGSSEAGRRSGIGHMRGRGMIAVLALADGRTLLADESAAHHHRPFAALLMLALLAAMLALASFPVAKRLARRIERLRTAVDELGGGDLRARVAVEGRDEVAELAQSFNRAAERIEKLVHAQKDALATASHELRSPLARMRVALELLESGRTDVRDRMARDIAELDELIGEILLASRLDATPAVERRDEVELLALVAEEGARVGAETGGSAATVRGDARLLRRLVRNLFENAKRYGGGSDIDAEVATGPDGHVVLRVHDRGAGIPEAERERVFEAFYRRAGTAEGEGGGVGLGLALVRRIAERHGGTARALPRHGGGTTIEVTLAPS